MKKTIWTVAAAVLLLCLLAGCRTQQPGTPDTGSGTQVQTDSAAAGGQGGTRTDTAPVTEKSTETDAPHVHEWKTEFVEPTLTSQGYTKSVCTCGESSVSGYTGLTGEKETEQTMKYRILFIGNSYTYYNGMSMLFEMIAKGQGYAPEVLSVTASAYYLHQFNDPTDENGKKVQAQLTGEKHFDVVFVQEQTTNPALNAADFYTNVRKLHTKILAQGGSMVLYQTWGRKTGNSVLSKNGWTNETMTYKIGAAYEAIAAELESALSPVGSAFYDVYTNHPEIELYNEDKSHPSLAGSYLAALCHYAAVWGKSPIGVRFVPRGISAQDALILQTAAHQAVFGGSIIPESYRQTSVGVGK